MSITTLETIRTKAVDAFESAKAISALEEVTKKHLGRKSALAAFLRSLKDLPSEERKDLGSRANIIRKELYDLAENRKNTLEELSYNWEVERIDVTLPGSRAFLRSVGVRHILTQVRHEIEDVFLKMGFDVADGPEVETEWYNFDALNIPKNHPARDEWDTFWLNEKDITGQALALRPHTSPAQIHYMQSHTPPFRIIVPGKCFRNEATDSTHEHSFYQFEALVVGDDISVGHFKYIGEVFFSRFFGTDVTIRLRPSFFPFTEPSFEFDISCTVCGGSGCSACKQTGWLEIGGAGMVNQAVFEAAGYKRGRYLGFAWGFGIERLAMMKYKIEDVRLFHSGDMRFLRQFS